MTYATDALVARYTAESEERAAFMDQVVEQAEQEGRDLQPEEMELLTRTRERIRMINTQLEPLRDAAQLARVSRDRHREITQEIAVARGEAANPGNIEYRSAGAWVCDYWQARTGNDAAKARLAVWERAASHQTTADNAGLIPTPILGPVLNFIDAARPLIGV